MNDLSAAKTASVEKQVGVFLGLTVLLSTPWWVLLAKYKMHEHFSLVLGLMCSPGVAGLASAWICGVPMRRFGWRWPRWKWIAAGYLIPIGYSLLAYSFVWITGLGHVQQREMHGPGQMLWMPLWLSFLTLIPTGVIPLVLGLLGGGTLGALGEEIGWRGFLVPALASRLSFVKTSLTIGTIWALWHLPFLIYGGYQGQTPRWYSFLCFAAMVIPSGFLYVWVRLRSGSLWPCVLLHEMHNFWIQTVLTPSTGDTGLTRWWIDEFGAALAIVTIVMGLYIWRRQRGTLGALLPLPVVDGAVGPGAGSWRPR